MSARFGFLASAVLMTAMAVAPGAVSAATDPYQVLPHATFSAITIDLDGDGAAELVRLVNSSGPGFVVEAWDVADGDWSVERSVDLAVEADAVDAEPRGEIATLLMWRLNGEERALVVSAFTDQRVSSGHICCLQVREVRAIGDDLELLDMPMPGLDVQQAQAMDLDGDGTDELMLTAVPIDRTEFRTQLIFLAWDGTRFASFHERELGESTMVGGSASNGGEFVLIGPTSNGDLMRLSMVDGEMREELAHLGLGQEFGGWTAATVGDAIVLIGSDGVRVVQWPRRGNAEMSAHLSTPRYPSVWVMPNAPQPLVLTLDGPRRPGDGPPSIAVRDLGLRLVGELEPQPSTIALWDILGSELSYGQFQRNIFPYYGSLPGLVDGEPAFVASGVLVQPDDSDGFVSRDIASFIGMQPAGRVGPEDAYVAMGDGFFSPTNAYLYPTGTYPPDAGRFVIADLDALLDPGPAEATVRVVDAVEVPGEQDAITVLSPGDGFSLEIAASPGSFVIAPLGATLQAKEVADRPVVLEVRPQRGESGTRNLEFDRWVAIIGPDGRSRRVLLKGTFVREDPTLTARASTGLFSLRATISGRASEGSAVTVDCQPAQVSDSGRFSVEVDAPIWPREVTVVAADGLGHEITVTRQIVGFADYRGLPLIPIVGLGTVAAGAFLFVRTPRRRAVSELGPAGDGTLEEIDAD
ncbi:MAG: hypothetical protein ABIO99_04605 [Candidatus Limnocylindria bacterium]